VLKRKDGLEYKRKWVDCLFDNEHKGSTVGEVVCLAKGIIWSLSWRLTIIKVTIRLTIRLTIMEVTIRSGCRALRHHLHAGYMGLL
jgi:hypothetical protein